MCTACQMPICGTTALVHATCVDLEMLNHAIVTDDEEAVWEDFSVGIEGLCYMRECRLAVLRKQMSIEDWQERFPGDEMPKSEVLEDDDESDTIQKFQDLYDEMKRIDAERRRNGYPPASAS